MSLVRQKRSLPVPRQGCDRRLVSPAPEAGREVELELGKPCGDTEAVLPIAAHMAVQQGE